MREPTRHVIITAHFGMYIWYPELQSVDFIQPGEQTPLRTLRLVNNNTQKGAMRAALKHASVVLEDRIQKEKGGIDGDFDCMS